MARKQFVRKRYTNAQKKHILSVAKKEGLTGREIRERFGIAMLTFYKWRGPVRRKRNAGRAAVRAAVNRSALRREVRASLREVLPRVIREEVAAVVRELIGR